MAEARWKSSVAVAAAVLLLAAAGGPGARGADLSTADGLTLRLDDATGAVQAVAVGGRTLPALAAVPGGLSCRERRPVERHEPRLLASADFEEDKQGWVEVANAHWKRGEEIAALRRADGGADGSRGYARLGEVRRYGHGVGLNERVPVEPGSLVEISWSARVPEGATYILYLRLLDRSGSDVTEKTPAPGKWRYSPWSTTHYQHLIGTKRANAWERLSRMYLVPEGVASLRVALCLWRGDYADADSLRVARVGSAGWLKATAPRGPLTREPGGKVCHQRLSMRDEGLQFTLKYVPGPDHIRVEGEVRDTHTPTRNRALRLCYTLPVGAAGWWWHDDIRTRRRIEAAGVYRKGFSCAGHDVSTYPFSCISDGASGLALGVPMDWPRMEGRTYSAERGYRTTFDVGLSPLTAKIGAGRATFAFVIYRADPQWGFRSAAAKYYGMFPQFFVKRAEREGCWLYPVRPSEIPNPEDFGLTFWEGFSSKPEERACAREHGIYILPYTEAWGLRQPIPGVEERSDVPPYEEVLATLKLWAADRASQEKWHRGPRWETAQAVLNSLPQGADGRAPFVLDKYGAWAHWWRTNPDPDLPQPSRWSICTKRRIDPVIPHADGIYLDSVTVWLGGYENYRDQHIACADLPLTFGVETGRPCIVGVMSNYEFIAWLADRLHPQGKLIQMNVFRSSLRFYAHLGDVLGSEVGSSGRNRKLSEVESDAVSCMRRTLAYRKPTTNLLQEGSYRSPVPALTRQQVEQYIDHQTFYGFHPGIATAGGEEKPGYPGWKRYFRSPEQCERDRDLFKRYIPVIARVNKAGWEPITCATTPNEAVMVERFGRWDTRDLHLTLRSRAKAEGACTLTVQLVALGAKREELGSVFARDLLSGFRAQARPGGSAGTVAFQIVLRPARTAVIALSGEKPH